MPTHNPPAADTLFDLPDHYIRDRAAWRRTVQRRRGLSIGARYYAGHLAFHRSGKGKVAWLRDQAAHALHVSVRTIQRWTAELIAAGWLERVVTALPGRRQVLRLVSPQVRMGDTGVSPSGGTGTTGHAYPTAEPSPAGPAAAGHRASSLRRPVNRPWSRSAEQTSANLPLFSTPSRRPA